jgi:hypothetical protein
MSGIVKQLILNGMSMIVQHKTLSLMQNLQDHFQVVHTLEVFTIQQTIKLFLFLEIKHLKMNGTPFKILDYHKFLVN